MADAITRRELAGIVIAIATILLVPEASGAAMAELLEKVNLSVYSRPTIPPDFDGRTVDNREMSLRSLQGKVVVLNFWATWASNADRRCRDSNGCIESSLLEDSP